MTEEKEKLSIDWDDLRARRVDTRLREQDAMARNRSYAQMQEDALPVASAPKGSILNNAIICMTLFGLIGGFLAWGMETLIAGPLTPVIGSMFQYDPNARADADSRLKEIQQIDLRRETKQFDSAQAQVAMEEVRADGRNNAYFRVETDDKLSPTQKKMQLDDLESNDRMAAFWMNLLSYGLCGMMIAMCLAAAEPITQHKTKLAWINCGAGAATGLIGGVAAALLTEPITHFIASMTEHQHAWIRQLVSQSALWGTLGLFLGLGSGIVLRNVRKMTVGVLGGLCGGLIGGALFNPVQHLAHDPRISRLVALIAIGVVAGLATGLLENVIKAGWLKVTSGIIAGKQFILYRNPTYIGSSPDCQIYLFKDAEVGRRHAAIHLAAGGVEIEDLPLGSPTFVNGKPIRRARLRNGDTIEIGATSFRFQEKRPTAGD